MTHLPQAAASAAPPVEQFSKRAVIVNPFSGSGRTGRHWVAFEPEVREALGEFTLIPTTGPRHATEVARNALHEGYDLIVSAGGDGTNFEVVNGFFENGTAINANAALGFLPVGTGSDFRRTLNIGRGRKSIQALREGEVHTADLGRIDSVDDAGAAMSRYFLNITHIGLGGRVGEYVNGSSKALGGFTTFLIGLLGSRFTYRARTMRITVNGVAIGGVHLDVIVAKGQYEGGGMLVAPQARLDNGYFDVYVVGDIGLLETIVHLPKLYRGRLDLHPKVGYYRARRVYMEADERTLISPDGELAGRLPATLEVVPRAIRLLTGPNPPGFADQV